MSFAERQLSFSIQLGSGDFGSAGLNTVDVPPGLWAEARIDRVAAPDYNSADIEIEGLPIDLMNQLSNIGLQAGTIRYNVVTVKAGNRGEEPSVVFAGIIRDAWMDFGSESEVIFKMNASTALYAAMKPVKPTSYTGPTSIVTIMQTLADQMGFTLENNNVSGTLNNPYLAGSARQQAIAAADAADIYVVFEDDKGVMAIVPKDSARQTLAPTIAAPPLGQMKGYPAYIGPGSVYVECEYNPQLRYLGSFNIANSIVKNANGTWRVQDLKHDLSTRPGGPWFSYVKGSNIYKGVSSS